jgi:hypothetical protein
MKAAGDATHGSGRRQDPAMSFGRVGTDLRKPGLDFIGPHNSVDGIAAPLGPQLSEVQTVARAGPWRVARVTVPGRQDSCVGR